MEKSESVTSSEQNRNKLNNLNYSIRKNKNYCCKNHFRFSNHFAKNEEEKKKIPITLLQQARNLKMIPITLRISLIVLIRRIISSIIPISLMLICLTDHFYYFLSHNITQPSTFTSILSILVTSLE